MKRFFHLETRLKCAEMVNFILPWKLLQNCLSEIMLKKELVI